MAEIYIPVYEQYTLTIKEAASYFRIGETSCGGWQKKTRMRRG